MYKRLVSCILIFLTACSSQQHHPALGIGSNPFDQTDASSVPYIDRDAYVVDVPIIPISSDAGLLPQLSIVDGAGPNGELIRPMRQGQTAPFSGVLFNSPALAYLEVEFRARSAQCQINTRADLQRLAARAVADISHLEVAYQTQQHIYNIVVSGRDQEITRLQTRIEQLEHPSVLPTVLWTMAGFLTGGMVVALSWFFSSFVH